MGFNPEKKFATRSANQFGIKFIQDGKNYTMNHIEVDDKGVAVPTETPEQLAEKKRLAEVKKAAALELKALRAEAKKLKVVGFGKMNAEQLKAAIAAVKK